jgi:capsid protein
MPASAVPQSETSFVSRLVTAFVELALAAAVIAGAIVVGHDLREWRDWYPSAYHPWTDGQRPTTEVTEP